MADIETIRPWEGRTLLDRDGGRIGIIDAIYLDDRSVATSRDATGRDATGSAWGGPDTSGPTTDDAMTRSEEELRVGTTQRERGRVRLRKYVTTE